MNSPNKRTPSKPTYSPATQPPPKRKAPDQLVPMPHANDSYQDYVAVSNTIYDRRSRFTAYFSPTVPLSGLRKVRDADGADHRIAAWRLPSKQRTLDNSDNVLVERGSDDDGERGGGARALAVLDAEGVSGTVVVARWYGGILLGPRRFEHIEKCAQDAIAQWRQHLAANGKRQRKAGESTGANPGLSLSPGQRQEEKQTYSPQELQRERQRLIHSLTERDANIVVLRDMLKSKRAQLAGEEGAGSGSTMSSPRKNRDYTRERLEVLKRIELQRDSTVEVLLKEIGKAEEEVADAKQFEAEAIDDEAWEAAEAAMAADKTSGQQKPPAEQDNPFWRK